MKIYVTQGHEKGIGLEVFFKSCLMLNKVDLNQIVLLAFKQDVIDTLSTMMLPFKCHENSISLVGMAIAVQWLEIKEHGHSFTALNHGMKLAEKGGVLFTLPTSKDQFPGYAGHTEYFRAVYQQPELGMFFSSPKLKILLLSDHIPVSALASELSEEIIFGRLKNCLDTFQQWSWPIERMLVSGFNPHAGEGGLIGHEDSRVSSAIRRLRLDYKIQITGPISGDTMLLEQKSQSDLLVYMFHDQGLGIFKGLQGFIGANITLGLSYPRFSPDHGTSFALYGKNHADYRGCEYSLKEALNMLKKVSNGKNSSHKSKSS
jgi:4-hydroxythreonine-4-phosphate dehydrogenase